MKDKNNIELEIGDAIIINFVKFIDQNDIKAVYHSVNTDGDLVYYPIDSIGLSLAKYQAGESMSGFYRATTFLIKDIREDQLLFLDPSNLSPAEMYYYNRIITRIS